MEINAKYHVMEFVDSSDRILKVTDYQEYQYKGYTIKRLDYLRQSEDASLKFYPVRQWMYFYEGMYKPKAWEPQTTNQLKPKTLENGELRLSYYDSKARETVIFAGFIPDCGIYLSDDKMEEMASEMSLPMYWQKYEYNESEWDVD